MAELNMVQAINQALLGEMKRDEKTLVFGQDVGVNGGVFRVTDGLQKEFGEKRVIDTPLAESGIIGMAVGLCVKGYRPIPELQFSGFAWFGFAQIEAHVARLRTRSQGKYTMPMTIRMPYGGGVRALEHHSESPEAIYGHVPGLKVVIPSGPRNAAGLLRSAIRDPDPVIFLEPKASYRAFREEVPDDDETVEIGKAQVVQEGGDVTVIGYGAMMPRIREAVEDIDGDCEVIDLLTISPLDGDTIADSVRKTGRAVIVHEASRSYGPAGEITARLMEDAFLHLEAPIARVTGYDLHMPFFSREQSYLPGADRIREAIERTLAFEA
jgi:pyruvate dehydrogenase E1 component beta subunit